MQPKSVRDRHALIISSIFTGIIASVWVFTQLQFDVNDERLIATETKPPFSNLVSGLKEQWASLTAALPDAPASDGVESGLEEALPLRADQLQLNEETLEQVRAASTAVLDGATSTSVEAMIAPQEVQIVTVPSVSATTSATTTE